MNRRWMAALFALAVLAAAAGRATAEDARPPSLESALRAAAPEPIRLIWSSRLVRPDMTVDEAPPDGPLPERLDALLAPHDLAAVEAPPGTWTVVARDDPAARGSLAVRVRSRRDSRPLAGCRVEIAGRVEGTTGADGQVLLEGLRPGRYAVTVRYADAALGAAATATAQVLPGRQGDLEVGLELLPVTAEEIVVTPSRTTLLAGDPEGALSLDREEIRRMPNLGDDLLRAAARLPGAAGDDFSAQFGVRGGEPREVALRIDGLDIPRPYHLPDLQSLFSVVDAGIVDRLDLYTGGFPVNLGNVQSGVLEATSRSPSEPLTYEVGVSFLTARAVAGGAFAGGGGWLGAVRRGYLDVVLQAVDAGGNLDPAYSDLFFKVERPLGRRHVAAVETFLLDDRERFTGDDPREEQLAGTARGGTFWLRLDSAWTPRLASRWVLGWSRRENQRSGFTNDGRGRLDDDRRSDRATLRQEWTFDGSPRLRLAAGWSVERSEASYDFESVHLTTDPVILRGAPPVRVERQARLSPTGTAYGAYLSERWRPNERFALEVGARYDRQDWLSDAQTSPRLHLYWRLGSRTELRAAWGLYDQPQAVDELQVDDGVDTFHGVEEAEHRILSLGRRLGARAGSVRVEAYEKLLPHPAARFENLYDPIQLFPSVEDDRIEVAPERARVRGVEASWSAAPSRRTRLDLAYTWSRAEDLVAGRWEPRRFDQTHAATAIFAVFPAPRWSLELVAAVHTGWPTTAARLVTVPGPTGEPVLGVELGPRNGERFPTYQRLDLRVRRSRPTARGAFDVYFEVFNLLDRHNLCCVDRFEVAPGEDGTPVLQPVYDDWLPLVPSFGLVWRRP